MSQSNIKISDEACSLSLKLCEMSTSSKGRFSLALSGGSSPLSLFRLWRGEFLEKIPWSKIDIYWVDERCVPSESNESNFGVAEREILNIIESEGVRFFPIDGVADPELEAMRYSQLVNSNLKTNKVNLPVFEGGEFNLKSVEIPIFDFVILGIGDDGHTSSIFPGYTELLYSDKTYLHTVNPYNGQKRVALTGFPIEFAKFAAFYAEGEAKSSIVAKAQNIVANAGLAGGNGLYDLNYVDFPVADLLLRSKRAKIYYGK